MSASCSSSTHSAPPPTATSSPRSLPELTSAMSTMEIDTEHNSSQSNTEISNIGVPGRESLQLKNGIRAPQASLSGYYLSNNYSFPPDPRTAESFRIQRFLEDEDQNRMSSLALDNTPPSTILTFCTPRTEIFQGLRKKRTKRKRSAHAASKKKVKRRNRATEASSVHAKVGSLPAEDRFAREFGEEQFESGRKWFVNMHVELGTTKRKFLMDLFIFLFQFTSVQLTFFFFSFCAAPSPSSCSGRTSHRAGIYLLS